MKEDPYADSPDRPSLGNQHDAHRDLRALQALAGLLRQKWSPAILLALADGPHSYTSLLRAAGEMPIEGNLTAKTATATTRALRDQGLITITRATDQSRFHTSSRYALTRHGQELVAKLRDNVRFLTQPSAERGADLAPGGRPSRPA